jgi:dihydrofolate reductase
MVLRREARGGLEPREHRPGASGARHLYVDGSLTIQAFIRAGLIKRIIVSQLPILIGQGIPLFGPLEKDVRLRLVSSRSYNGGMVQSEYELLSAV